MGIEGIDNLKPDGEPGESYIRVDGRARCSICGEQWYNHPVEIKFDASEGQEMGLHRACDGRLLKT